MTAVLKGNVLLVSRNFMAVYHNTNEASVSASDRRASSNTLDGAEDRRVYGHECCRAFREYEIRLKTCSQNSNDHPV
jgi:hypothetical protein